MIADDTGDMWIVDQTTPEPHSANEDDVYTVNQCILAGKVQWGGLLQHCTDIALHNPMNLIL